MLTIRHAQLQALRQVPLQSFEDRMARHLARYFPEDCTMLGDGGVHAVIGLGRQRAARRGFATTGDVCRYIGLMFMLGSRFDEDPQLAWAVALRDGASMDALHDAGVRYLERVAGPSGEYYRRALLRLRGGQFDELAALAGDGGAPGIAALCEALWPRKAAELGTTGTARLHALAQEAARRHGLPAAGGVAACAALMLVLGTAFDRDPLYPWAAAALAQRGATVPAVHRDCLAVLERYLALRRAAGRA